MRRAGALVLVALVAAACLGPKPAVESASVEKGDQPGKANATVVVVNRGDGDGPTRVSVTLRSGDRIVARDSRTVDLQKEERLTLVFELDIPEDAGELEVEAKVAYPPD